MRSFLRLIIGYILYYTLCEIPPHAHFSYPSQQPLKYLCGPARKNMREGQYRRQATERDEPKVHKIPHVRATVPLTINSDGVLVVRLSVEEDDPNGQRGKDYAYDEEEPAPRMRVASVFWRSSSLFVSSMHAQV